MKSRRHFVPAVLVLVPLAVALGAAACGGGATTTKAVTTTAATSGQLSSTQAPAPARTYTQTTTPTTVTTASANSAADEDLQSIRELLEKSETTQFEVAEYRISRPWAAVFLHATGVNTDDMPTLLKKQDGTWAVVDCGTGLERSDWAKYGPPPEILDFLTQ